MGKLRAEWQGFKKEWPQFDQAKGDKLNLGPLLDEHEKFCASIIKDMEELDKALLTWANSREKLRGAYKLYEKVADELGKTDKKIVGNFNAVWDIPKNMSVPYYLKSKFIPRVARV